MPFVVPSRESELIEMPQDACHGHGAIAPWWTKVEIEIVVLYIWIAGDTSLQNHELELPLTNRKSTNCSYLPSAQMLSYRFGNGWLLSNAKDLACHAVLSSEYLYGAYNESIPYFKVYTRFPKQY